VRASGGWVGAQRRKGGVRTERVCGRHLAPQRQRAASGGGAHGARARLEDEGKHGHHQQQPHRVTHRHHTVVGAHLRRKGTGDCHFSPPSAGRAKQPHRRRGWGGSSPLRLSKPCPRDAWRGGASRRHAGAYTFSQGDTPTSSRVRVCELSDGSWVWRRVAGGCDMEESPTAPRRP
jgi:hypothetical protein